MLLSSVSVCVLDMCYRRAWIYDAGNPPRTLFVNYGGALLISQYFQIVILRNVVAIPGKRSSRDALIVRPVRHPSLTCGHGHALMPEAPRTAASVSRTHCRQEGGQSERTERERSGGARTHSKMWTLSPCPMSATVGRLSFGSEGWGTWRRSLRAAPAFSPCC